MLFYKTVLNIILQLKCLFLIKILDIKTKVPKACHCKSHFITWRNSSKRLRKCICNLNKLVYRSDNLSHLLLKLTYTMVRMR